MLPDYQRRAFIEHLKKQPAGTIIYNTSVLGFVPLALAAVYRRGFRLPYSNVALIFNKRKRSWLRQTPKSARRVPLIFPKSLNGDGGFQSSALTNLFTGPAVAWSFGALLTQPIFTGRRLRSQVRLAEARQQTAVLFYQQSIQGAFRSVSYGLVAYRKIREFRTTRIALPVRRGRPSRL
jgi:hypothetical protein